MTVLAQSTGATPESWGGPDENQDKTNPAKVTLGIASMSFSGDMMAPEGGPVTYRFTSEPKIRKVDPAGPAAGILREGDVIAAIDGRLITTNEGGFRFGNPVEGKPVTPTIRRGGSEKK